MKATSVFENARLAERSLKSLWGTLNLTLNSGQTVGVPYITGDSGWLNVVECGKHRF